MVEAHGVLLASPPPASQGSAVQTAHSPVWAVTVRVDQAQVQLGGGYKLRWGWLEGSESCEGHPALSAGPCTEGGLILRNTQ